MVLSVVRGEVSLATPALHQSLARRAAVGRPQHGEWDCSDIPTEAQLQMQRHAAERLEQQQRELRREEAEAAAAEAKRDKELAEAVEAEIQADRQAEMARAAQIQAVKERKDVDVYRRALQESELALSVIALKHDRKTRTGAAVLDAAEERVKQARERLRLEIAEAEEADAHAAEQIAKAERAMAMARKERQEATDAQAEAEQERAEAIAAASKTSAQLQSLNRSLSVAGARPPPVRRPNLAKTKLKQLFQAMFRLTDLDGDGNVDVEECIVLDRQVAEVTGQKFDEAGTRAAWNAMDINGDGEVSVHEYVEVQLQNIAPQDYEEMCTAMRGVIKKVEELRRRRKFLKTRLEGLFLKAFKLCDVNSDGGVSMEECVVLDKQIAEVTGNLQTFIENDSRRLWKSMDVNGDGEVSAKEYVQYMMGTIPMEQHEAAGDILVQTLTDVATLRRERRGHRAQLVELLRKAFELCDEDGSGEVDPDECIKLDKEIAAVSGRDFDEEGTRKAFDTMDANGDGVVSFYEYTTLQLQLIQPEKYAATVESLTTLLPTVAAHRKAEKDRAAEERRLTKAAKAKAFNYRLEQILSTHGGAAAVVVGNGAQSAVRSWDSQCQDLTGTEQADDNGVSWREKRLHWSGEERKMSGLRMGRLPKENLQRLAGEHASDHPLQAKSRSWEAAQHQADTEIQHEEAEIMHEQLAEDLQRRKKVAASCDQAASEDEEELTFEEYVEVAQLAAIEEGGKDCDDELDRELLRQMFDEVDVDCSGTVTLSELAAHRHQAEERLRNKQREAFHQDLEACKARDKENEKQARREMRQQEKLQQRDEKNLTNDDEIFAGRYTVTLRGCDTPQLAYGVRGGLIAVVKAPLNHHASTAGIRPGDEVIAVDGAPIGSSSKGVKVLEAAAIQRMQGLRGRRAVSWVLRRPRRVFAARRPSTSSSLSSPSSSSSSSMSEVDVAMLEMSEQERRLMGVLGKTG